MLLFRLLFCKSSIYISLVLVNPNLKLLYIDNHNSRFYFQKSSTGIKISTIKYNKINFFYLQGDCGKSVFPGAGQVCRPPGDQLECRQRRPGEGDDLSREIETGSWFIILNISELLPTAAGSYHQTPGHGHHVTSPKAGQRVFGHFTVFLNPSFFFFSAVKLRISLKNISPQSRPSRLVTSDKDQTALSNDSP